MATVNAKNIDPDRLIFALDVGTRTVVGLVCYPENEKIKVLGVEVEEHPDRNMVDGQIHNIEGVTRTARRVTDKLQKKLDVKFSRVAVAAAGRSLTTVESNVIREINPEQRILPDEILELELEGVNKAQKQLSAGGNNRQAHYCVGYTTICYSLDGQPITSLLSQKGRTMGARVLATFLPNAVVDSLLTVVERLGLSLHSLTLEPIAAMQVLIPPKYRMLNLALVDIGAGTSDIAITRQGSIIAYAMVRLAGDEVTEKIVDHYLLDFNDAEKIKIGLSGGKDKFAVKDILGNRINITGKEVIQLIKPVVTDIADHIVQAILHYNQSATRALFLIGGGSKTPLLREMLAEKLDLPPEMVAIRDYSSLQHFSYRGKKLRGPECVTPLGIVQSSLKKRFFGFSYVTVNGKVVRLLETEPISVGRVLLIAGYSPRSIIGLRGKSKTITVNNDKKTFPGKPGENARITLNNNPASLDDIVSPNDVIEVEPAVSGEPPLISVRDLYTPDDYYIYLQGEKMLIRPLITLNGKPVNDGYILNDGDEVTIKGLGTLKELANTLNLNHTGFIITVNGRQVEYSTLIYPGDRISIEQPS